METPRRALGPLDTHFAKIRACFPAGACACLCPWGSGGTARDGRAALAAIGNPTKGLRPSRHPFRKNARMLPCWSMRVLLLPRPSAEGRCEGSQRATAKPFGCARRRETPVKQIPYFKQEMRCEGVQGATAKPPGRLRRGETPAKQISCFNKGCGAKVSKGRPQSPLVASAEAKPCALLARRCCRHARSLVTARAVFAARKDACGAGALPRIPGGAPPLHPAKGLRPSRHPSRERRSRFPSDAVRVLLIPS